MRVSAVLRRVVDVSITPRFERLANSRRARTRLNAVSGSITVSVRSRPEAMVACSSWVAALSAPTENAPMRPASLAAPRMVTAAGPSM